jgi:hypothetical protein
MKVDIPALMKYLQLSVGTEIQAFGKISFCNGPPRII